MPSPFYISVPNTHVLIVGYRVAFEHVCADMFNEAYLYGIYGFMVGFGNRWCLGLGPLSAVGATKSSCMVPRGNDSTLIEATSGMFTFSSTMSLSSFHVMSS
jgi:hypothetical protein